MNNLHRNVISFDFGLRNIGVAVGNCRLGTTQPLAVLKARDGQPDWPALTNLVSEWQPERLVVGDPLNMDGSDSELSQLAAKFARRLHGRLGLPVDMVDERLSSAEAKSISREQGHRGDYTANPVDSLAAELILKSWLERARGEA